jgi:hypothetical protein
MKRRSKQNIKYFTDRTEKLLKQYPEYRSVKKRYDAIALILQGKYPKIKQNREVMARLFKDVVYIDRKLRAMTEGEEEEEKKILSQEKQIEMGYEPNYYQDIKKLKQL